MSLNKRAAVDTLRANIHALMAANGCPSENALAREVKVACHGDGVDQKTINNLMRGASANVRVATVEALARWARLPTWSLLVPVHDVADLRSLAEIVGKLAELGAADTDVVMAMVRRADETASMLSAKVADLNRSVNHNNTD